MEKRLRIFGFWALPLILSTGLYAQYPGHPAKDKEKNVQKLRSVAVLEWTGEPGKPSASRIIPIAIYDGERYQDGGLYLAQPAPLSVISGTEYELEQAGTPKGLFDVFSAQNQQGSWYGYGVWKPLVPVKQHKLAKSQVPPTVVKDNDPDRPTLKKADTGGKSDTADAGSTNKTESSDDQANSDPSKPTLHRRQSSDEADGSKAGSAESKPAAKPTEVDPDRPTLHKHSTSPTPTDSTGNSAPVTAMATSDPNRPKLRRGVPEGEVAEVEPTKLTGTPPELQQMAAVSDSAKLEPHPFTYSWANPEDMGKTKAALELLAKKALAQGGWTPLTQPVPGARPAAKPKVTPRTAAARRAAAANKAKQPDLPELSDEKMSSYELSSSGGATLVFSAKTGEGTSERYVTLIAQPDFYGVPHVLLQSVTDADHLDVKPRMRLVDAVDTNGDNHGELIFELRAKSDRQFAIYRISGGRALQTFTTASLQ